MLPNAKLAVLLPLLASLSSTLSAPHPAITANEMTQLSKSGHLLEKKEYTLSLEQKVAVNTDGSMISDIIEPSAYIEQTTVSSSSSAATTAESSSSVLPLGAIQTTKASTVSDATSTDLPSSASEELTIASSGAETPASTSVSDNKPLSTSSSPASTTDPGISSTEDVLVSSATGASVPADQLENFSTTQVDTSTASTAISTSATEPSSNVPSVSDTASAVQSGVVTSAPAAVETSSDSSIHTFSLSASSSDPSNPYGVNEPPASTSNCTLGSRECHGQTMLICDYIQTPPDMSLGWIRQECAVSCDAATGFCV
ncbi:uncharacterized protein I303_104863 [Kwoniella dejecticola CBS 10117]|uniref:ShKT domain-containing protein n=1 Tax=Kwoniella dejecticola CBS 10117 TaxID=1296121 RepID=A0A1A6A451_9TREE|nr:uncharacterized protein I303_04154 [Kwoniella dejecticola CBS 10117]OBR84833.1 hypothetical protein I303_04154 [Kwoniella dejecticola CBS 10117]